MYAFCSVPPHLPIFPRKNYIITLQRVHHLPVLQYLRQMEVRAKGTLLFLGLSVARIKLAYLTVLHHFPGHSIEKLPFLKSPKALLFMVPWGSHLHSKINLLIYLSVCNLLRLTQVIYLCG